MSNIDGNNNRLRALPSVDALLKTETAQGLIDEVGLARLTTLARLATDDLRECLLKQTTAAPDNGNANRSELLKAAEERLLKLHQMQIAAGRFAFPASAPPPRHGSR